MVAILGVDVSARGERLRQAVEAPCMGTFHVRNGRTDQEVAQASTAPEPGVVLVVEDNDGDAFLLSEILGEVGLTMRRVARLAAAVSLVRSQVFDFVLCDLNLPDARGTDTVRALSPIVGESPLIVMTGMDDDELAAQAVKAGAQDYLVKGHVDATILRRTLRHARERKQLVKQLVQMTRRDALTGALNRLALRERLESAFADGDTGTAFAVMYLDLDHFKAINDTLGHDAGDAVLCEVVRRLTHATRQHDLVARLGGDEFAIFLDRFASHAALLEIADRVLRSLQAPISVASTRVVVTSSIGIACYPDAALSVDEILKCADAAMYQAKQRGRNTAVIAGAGAEAAREQADLPQALRFALARRELVLHFQPQFEIVGRRMVGVEALLRWQRADGLVPPSEFIPLLERSGQIVAVGEWVIEEACRQLATWRERGHDQLRVAVNVSARQFEDAGLVACIERWLNEFHLPGNALELEITESSMMANLRATKEMLRDLRRTGVRVAIDDFGTGFSSLSYLNQFEVDCLKLDRSLVEQVHTPGNGAAVVQAVISLGHNLGLEVIAEGVEVPEQLGALAAARCNLAQGFLLGRPTRELPFELLDFWTEGPQLPATVRIRPVRCGA